MTTSLVARANAGLPNVSYLTWQSIFFMGILLFTAFAMVEYAFVNFCSVFYIQRRKMINEHINKLRKKSEKENKYLAEARMKAQKQIKGTTEKGSTAHLDPTVVAQTPGFKNSNHPVENSEELEEQLKQEEEKKSSMDNSAFEVMEEDEHIEPAKNEQKHLKKSNLDRNEIYRQYSEMNDVQKGDSVSSKPQSNNAHEQYLFDLGLRAKKGSEPVKVSVGDFDKSQASSANFAKAKPVKSQFSKPSDLLPQISSVSFAQKEDSPNQVPSKREEGKKSNHTSQLSWDSFDSSNEKGEAGNLTSKPPPVKFRTKSKSFIFDFATERNNSMMPHTIDDNKKSTKDLLQVNYPGSRTMILGNDRNKLNANLSHLSRHNPEIYKSDLKQIKSFLNNTPGDVAKLEEKSMKIIQKIIKLENSLFFHISDFGTFKGDHYARILYPLAFMFWLIFMILILTDIKALYFT